MKTFMCFNAVDLMELLVSNLQYIVYKIS